MGRITSFTCYLHFLWCNKGDSWFSGMQVHVADPRWVLHPPALPSPSPQICSQSIHHIYSCLWLPQYRCRNLHLALLNFRMFAWANQPVRVPLDVIPSFQYVNSTAQLDVPLFQSSKTTPGCYSCSNVISNFIHQFPQDPWMQLIRSHECVCPSILHTDLPLCWNLISLISLVFVTDFSLISLEVDGATSQLLVKAMNSYFLGSSKLSS